MEENVKKYNKYDNWSYMCAFLISLLISSILINIYTDNFIYFIGIILCLTVIIYWYYNISKDLNISIIEVDEE